MPARIRPAQKPTSSKCVVTTVSHEQFLDRAARLVTALAGSAAVLVVSLLSISITLR
jgi:hypothetical protein